jgi:hypothetical protein
VSGTPQRDSAHLISGHFLADGFDARAPRLPAKFPVPSLPRKYVFRQKNLRAASRIIF